MNWLLNGYVFSQMYLIQFHWGWLNYKMYITVNKENNIINGQMKLIDAIDWTGNKWYYLFCKIATLIA